MQLQETLWTSQGDLPLLAIMQLLPVAAIIITQLLRKNKLLFLLSLGIAIIQLLLAIYIYQSFDLDSQSFQFAEQYILAGPIHYHAAVDGISVLFILLASLLTLLVVLYGPVRGFTPQSRYLAVVFAVHATVISSVVTVDLMWFVFMSAVQLFSIGYLLHHWSTSPDKAHAFTRFLQFMGTALLLLFAGTIMLGWSYAEFNEGQWSFDLIELAAVEVPTNMQSAIFFLLFYGMAIRIPLFPLHGWLPTIAEHGTIAVAPVFLLGLKTGIYGMLRFVLPLLPDAVMQWHLYVIGFAVAGVFYAALLALQQINLRRLLAFAVISHSGILVIGMFSLNHAAFQGSIILSANLGLAAAALLFMAGMVFRRTNTLLLEQLGGLFDRIPLIGVTFFLAGLSIVGMPGTPGFDSAHLVLEAAMHRYGALVTIAAALGNVVAAGFLLWAFQRAFLASKTRKTAHVESTTPLEAILSIIILSILLGTGFYSEPWLDLVENSLTNLDRLYAQ